MSVWLLSRVLLSDFNTCWAVKLIFTAGSLEKRNRIQYNKSITSMVLCILIILFGFYNYFIGYPFLLQGHNEHLILSVGLTFHTYPSRQK